MTRKFKHRMKTQYKINGIFQTQDVIDLGIECTWETVYNAICNETLKWFRKIGGKKKVTKKVKNGKHIITVFSYVPYDDKLRYKTIFEEV